ncbi:MAG: carbohydrate ABC transporter permease [Ilumatobacteraceae bacterium]
MSDATAPTGGEPLGRSVSAALTSRWGRWAVYLLVFLWTIPTFGTLVSSIRTEEEVKTTGWWTWFKNPSFTLNNYQRVLSSAPGEDNMGHFFLNSVRITVPATILSVGIALVAAYAFAWMKFKGRDWLFVVVVGLLMVPLQMALIPLLRLFTGGAHISFKLGLGVGIALLLLAVILFIRWREGWPVELFLALLGVFFVAYSAYKIKNDAPGALTVFPFLDLANSIPAVWIAHICFGLPFCIFILSNFVQALPKEIIEAARVDGAGHATVFIRLVVPLSVPAIASLCIFQFMYIWNDYLVGKVFGGAGENVPVVAKLAEVSGTRGQSWHLLTASGMVAMVVPICVFFALQRYFVRGLLAGAVKG